MKTNIHTNPVADFTSVNVEDRKNLRIKAGDTVKVWVKIKETSKGKEKIRLQAFEGMVLSTKHGTENGATFTVRKVSNGVGVERIFPLFSPNIDKIEILKRAKVRRAKLYHIREKVARQIKRQMRKATFANISSLSDIGEQERVAREEEERAAEEARIAEEKAAAEAKAAEEAAAKEAEAKAAEEAAATESSKEVAEDAPAEEPKAEEEEAKGEEKKEV